MTREKLNNRHDAITVNIPHSYRSRHEPDIYSITYSRNLEGKICEIWISLINGYEKLINDDMRDTCATASRDLQYGDSIEQLAKSVLRDNRGKPLGWFGTILDALRKEPVE